MRSIDILGILQTCIILSNVLASDLDDLSSVVSSPTGLITSVQDNLGISMDCLNIFPAEDYNTSYYHLYGVYHHNIPNTNDWDIYLAEYSSTESVLTDSWTRRTTLVSSTGSMPNIYRYLDPVTNAYSYILSYESMDSDTGNYIQWLFYSDLEALLASQSQYSTSLAKYKRIHIADDPNTYSEDYSSLIWNIGTPTISSASFIDNIWIIYFRFHYTTSYARTSDTPGYGVISYNPIIEVQNVSYYNWQGYFDNNVNNAIQIARSDQGGKIGQRAKITDNKLSYYVYEAQLTSSFDWNDWRLFLYSPDEVRAVQVPLNVSDVVDFCNPSITQLIDQTIVTVFIPSEGSNDQVTAGTMIYTLPLIS